MAVSSGAGLTMALCAWVWCVLGMLRLDSRYRVAAVLSSMLGRSTGSCGGIGSRGGHCLYHQEWHFQLGFRVHPGLILVTAVGLVQIGHGHGGCVGCWVFAGGFVSTIFWLILLL